MKKTANIKGAKVLSKEGQNIIKGGGGPIFCDALHPCPEGYWCNMPPNFPKGICEEGSAK
jgi:hypothetical protein